MAYTQINPAWYSDATPNPANEILLASYDASGDRRALELQLNVRPVTPPTPNFPPAQTQLPAGSDQAASLHAVPCGFLRIVARNSIPGESARERILYADLSSGRFALGAHDRVDVYASLWSGVVGLTIEAEAVVLPCDDGSGDWLRYTVPISGLGAAASVNVPIPMGARYVEAYATTGLPSVSMSGRVIAVRDFDGQAFAPPASPLAIPALGTDANSRFIVVTNDGSAAATCALVFWVA